MTQSVAQKYLYADLIWEEINEAVAMQKVILLPVGSTEQHGPQLLRVDHPTQPRTSASPKS